MPLRSCWLDFGCLSGRSSARYGVIHHQHRLAEFMRAGSLPDCSCNECKKDCGPALGRYLLSCTGKQNEKSSPTNASPEQRSRRHRRRWICGFVFRHPSSSGSQAIFADSSRSARAYHEAFVGYNKGEAQSRLIVSHACFSTPTICSTLNRFLLISKILRPLLARFLPKTNTQIGSKYRTIKGSLHVFIYEQAARRILALDGRHALDSREGIVLQAGETTSVPDPSGP